MLTITENVDANGIRKVEYVVCENCKQEYYVDCIKDLYMQMFLFLKPSRRFRKNWYKRRFYLFVPSRKRWNHPFKF